MDNNNPDGLSLQELRAWENNPTTQKVFELARIERAEWVSRLLDGDVLMASNVQVETARAIGIIYGIDLFLSGLKENLRDEIKERELERENNSE
jgi:hypothetical protein